MIRILLFACLLAFAPAALAELAGRVVAVHDGDTISVRTAERTVRVRMHGIDAPEDGQAHGNAARRALAERLIGRDVRVIERGRDPFGRTLGVVWLVEQNVNALQVQDGWAWVFRRYTSDAWLLALEVEARAARRGLWRDAHPIPPWQWRSRPEHRRMAPAAALSPP